MTILASVFFIGTGGVLGRISDLARGMRRRTAELEQAMTRLNTVLDTAPDAIITIDPAGLVTSWNAAAETMFGRSRADAIGKSLHSLVASPRYGTEGWPELPVFPRPDGQRAIQRSMASLEGVRADGTTFPAELSLGTFVEGGRRHAVGVVRDLSERKEAQERYRRLFEAVPVGLYRSTPDGQVLDANPAMIQILGFHDRESLMAMNAALFYENPADRDELGRRAKREQTVHMEVRLRRLDGMVIDCLMSVRAGRGPDGEVAWYEGSVRDVTEQRRLDALRSRSQRLESVGQLAAGVAHDINNILAGIQGFAELLARRPDAAAADAGKRITEAVARGAKVVEGLMAVMGRQLHRPVAAGLGGVVDTALAGLPAEIAGMVDRPAPPDPVAAIVDTDAIEVVVRELVLNAARASAAGGRIVVATGTGPATPASVLAPSGAAAGPWAWVSVSDRGTGMDARTVSRLFEPYFTSRDFGSGAGMGLVRVLGIVRQHGGGIDVQSAPGRGTTVRVFLPAPA